MYYDLTQQRKVSLIMTCEPIEVQLSTGLGLKHFADCRDGALLPGLAIGSVAT